MLFQLLKLSFIVIVILVYGPVFISERRLVYISERVDILVDVEPNGEVDFSLIVSKKWSGVIQKCSNQVVIVCWCFVILRICY